MSGVWGIIGGTGLDQLDGVHGARAEHVETPYGMTSAPLIHGTLGDARTPVVFLARHGSDHAIAPHEINYRANIWALAQSVDRVIAVAAVGGIRADLVPRSVVIPDQLIDYTWGRAHTFSVNGDIQHVDFSAPYADSCRSALCSAAAAAGVTVHMQAVYGATQGPRLETAAEIDRMARDGCDIVGMTGMPEAALARELGLAYACCALVVNEAAGRGPAVITMAEIQAHLTVGMQQIHGMLHHLP